MHLARLPWKHCFLHVIDLVIFVQTFIIDIVVAQVSQKLSWRDLFVQIDLGADIASLGIK